MGYNLNRRVYYAKYITADGSEYYAKVTAYFKKKDVAEKFREISARAYNRAVADGETPVVIRVTERPHWAGRRAI